MHFVEQGFLVYDYNINFHNCFGYIIVLFFQILWHRSFFEKKLLLLLPFQTSCRCLGKTMTKGVVTLFTMYWVTFLRLAFLIWRCARSFHRIFFQINIFHFFEESLSLPSAFVYLAIGKFLVPAACKIFCRKEKIVGSRIQCLSQQQNGFFHKFLNLF